ncbi:hypothetical protein BGZ98_002482 [Dissophora globulifera]|nr:hypothetical protein BGZ98_002482 [Dissophora globulifera]
MSISQVDLPEHSRRWSLLVSALVLYLYFARDYPRWRSDRLLQQKRADDTSNNTDISSPSLTMTPTESTQTPDALPPDTEPPSSWTSKFSIRWIPYIPFAVIYLVLKSLWAAMRFLVLHSLYLAELSGVYLMTVIEEIAYWTVNSGPDIIRTKILAPLQTVAMALWTSPAVAAVATVIENTVLPGIIRLAVFCHSSSQAIALKTLTWLRTMAEPAQAALTWFFVECLYNPFQAIWSRLSVLSCTFLQTAKIYFHELAKDALDLGWVALKVANWVWQRTLQPVASRLYSWGVLLVDALARFVPWLAVKIYSRLLCPVGSMLLDGFRILRSHPTLMAGLHALSIKVKEKTSIALQRLESVNWLVLLETTLTTVVTTAYHYTISTLQIIGHGLKVFAEDVVPNAYGDLVMALEFARPIVAWVVDKFVTVLHPLWQAVSWITWNVATNIRPTLAWLHQKIIVPTLTLWTSSIQPRLSQALAMFMTIAWELSNIISKLASVLLVVTAPAWSAVLKIAEMTQATLGQAVSQLIHLSGELGERIQEQVKGLAPKFEAFKAQIGLVMDEMVLATSTFMMDWAKKQKRD